MTSPTAVGVRRSTLLPRSVKAFLSRWRKLLLLTRLLRPTEGVASPAVSPETELPPGVRIPELDAFLLYCGLGRRELRIRE